MRFYFFYLIVLIFYSCSSAYENTPEFYLNTAYNPGDNFYFYVNGNWPVDSAKDVETVNNEMDSRLYKKILAVLIQNRESDSYRQFYEFYHSLVDSVGTQSSKVSLKGELALLDSFQSEKDVIPMMAAMFRRGYGGPISGEFYSHEQSYLFRTMPGSVEYVPQMNSGPHYSTYIRNIRNLVQEVTGILWTERETAEVASIYHTIHQIEREYHEPAARGDSIYYPVIPRIFAWLNELGVMEYSFRGLPPNSISYQMDSLISNYSLSSWKNFYVYTIIKEKKVIGLKRTETFNQDLFGVLTKYCPDPLTKLYKEHCFDSIKEAGIRIMAENIRQALIENLSNAAWLGESRKKELAALFDSTKIEISYPEFYEDYSSLIIKPDDPIGNYRRAREFQILKDIGYLGSGNIPSGKWLINTLKDSPTCYRSENAIYLPIDFSQNPLYSPSFDDAYNYGGLGFYIGHELAHLVDFDSEKLSDIDYYNEEESKLISQYGSYRSMSGYPLNGMKTRNENFADIVGLQAAFSAYSKLPSFKEEIDGYSGAERFYMAFANSQLEYRSEEAARKHIVNDEHTLYFQRVNGAVRNLDSFYETFNVTAQDSLYLSPEDRIIIW